MRAMAVSLVPRVQTLRTFAIILVALVVSFLLLGVPQFVNAMTLGAIYALIALGYTMVYGIIELINFAHGDVFMVGAFASLWVLTTPLGLPDRPIDNPLELAGILLIVVVPVMLFMGLVNVIIERVAYRPLRHAPRLAPLITAIGVSFMLQNFIQVLFGPSPHPTPQIFPRVDVLTIGTFNILGLQVTGGVLRGLNLTMVIVAVGLMAILQTFVSRTRLGRAMRSTAQDREAAELMGVDINTTIAITFFLAAALAGAGGVIYGLYFGSVQFNLGFYTGLKAFTAAVLGGIGNTVGAAVGGFVIAFIEVAAAQLGYNRWSEVAVFTVLILVLVFRPSGLFGQAVGERA
ncbi:MAG TPA: branched-chain amino acid ABC transporter permease [Candidatus Limnocylindrales bacterium]|nr:branched-chain amino acid ABC transporter permease [Candidatus Limnocylindrales bacterium]